MTENRALSVALLIVLALIWGTSFILIKQGLKAFPPDVVGALRVSAACILLLPFSLPRLRTLRAGDHLNVAMSGLMGTFIPAFLFAAAQTRLDSSLAGILNTLSPVWTVIIGAAFFQQRFRGWALLGILISFGGTVLLALSRAEGKITGFNAYALLIVAACALYGANLNWVKFRIAGIGALTLTSVSMLLVGPPAIAYLLLFTDFVSLLRTQPGAWEAFGYLVLLALLSTAIAGLLFNKLIRISTPLFASSVTYLMPLVAVSWGLLDGERLMSGHYIAMAAIIGGVYLANRR
jgi:drug/metabolite transporter (DMT)-like permease